jgi:hypothetical protein
MKVDTQIKTNPTTMFIGDLPENTLAVIESSGVKTMEPLEGVVVLKTYEGAVIGFDGNSSETPIRFWTKQNVPPSFVVRVLGPGESVVLTA